jgi:hypothetical protein
VTPAKLNSQVRPNLFIVGAPRCGTTSMHGYLAQHPQIFMSPVKEPRFWSDDLRGQGRDFHRNVYRRHLKSFKGLVTLPRCIWKRRRARPELNLGVERLDEYLALFEEADLATHRCIGEASPDSLWSENAAKRIATFNCEARIVIMLREPLS